MPKSRVALLIALVLALAACFDAEPEFSEAEQVPADVREAQEDGEPADDDAEDLPTVEFVAVDNQFQQAPTEVPAGQVRFELANEGNAPHNVVIDDLGDQLVVEADGGQTETGTVTLEPGEYRYHCDIPGHEPTMNGTFTVGD